MAVRNRVCGPTQCGITAMTPRCTKSGGKLDGGQRMPGAGLSCRRSRKAPLGKPTFQPYWGKPAVRNDREDRGNVGIIRSPLRASILPDYIGSNREELSPSKCLPGCPRQRTLLGTAGMSQTCQIRKLMAMVVTRDHASVHRLYGYRVPISPLITGPNSTPCSPLKRDICICSSGK